MSLHYIAPPQRYKQKGPALFNLGFRPFFLGAAIFSLLAMTVWVVSLMHPSTLSLPLTSVSAMQWHAHEMLFGYGLAVIAGFLLAAVKNWTGVQTLHGYPLGGLFAVWIIARLLLLCGTSYLLLAALLDLLFGVLLAVAITQPIVKVRQWKQLQVLSKLVLIVAANTVFYLGALGYINNGVDLALYAGLYIIVSLLLVMGRRVIPFFIERGVEETFTIQHYRWLDISIMVLFILLFINELFIRIPDISIYSALALFLLNGFRLCKWHTAGIWKVSLLWSLYISTWLINAGFLFLAISYWSELSFTITLHLFTIGGIGLMTVGMMGRVALGHTGRNIRQPSPVLSYALVALILSTIVRVFLPMIDMLHYNWWLAISYILWMVAFVLFLIIYTPILSKPRIDGHPG